MRLTRHPAVISIIEMYAESSQHRRVFLENQSVFSNGESQGLRASAMDRRSCSAGNILMLSPYDLCSSVQQTSAFVLSQEYGSASGLACGSI